MISARRALWWRSGIAVHRIWSFADRCPRARGLTLASNPWIASPLNLAGQSRLRARCPADLSSFPPALRIVARLAVNSSTCPAVSAKTIRVTCCSLCMVINMPSEQGHAAPRAWASRANDDVTDHRGAGSAADHRWRLATGREATRLRRASGARHQPHEERRRADPLRQAEASLRRRVPDPQSKTERSARTARETGNIPCRHRRPTCAKPRSC